MMFLSFVIDCPTYTLYTARITRAANIDNLKTHTGSVAQIGGVSTTNLGFS